MVNRATAPYRSGKFVVGGWTESVNRAFRALLIGPYTDSSNLEYVGPSRVSAPEMPGLAVLDWIDAERDL